MTNTISQVITVLNSATNLEATITPSDVSIVCFSNLVDLVDPTIDVSGTCDSSPSINPLEQSIDSADDVDAYPFVMTRTWDVSDNCGNSAVVTQTITIVGPAEDCCEGCGCPQGGGSGGVGNSFWYRIGLGDAPNGGEAGFVEVAGNELTPLHATPKALRVIGMARGVRSHHYKGTLRQIRSPQSAVEVVALDEFRYEMRFYHPDQVADISTNETVDPPEADPFVVWRIENPDASTNVYNRLHITQIVGSTSNRTEFIWSETNGWSYVQGGGLVTHTLAVEWLEPEVHKRSREIRKDGSNRIALDRIHEVYWFPFGKRVIRNVDDPDGANLETVWTYYTNSAHAGRFGKLARMDRPDGSWQALDYDSLGRKTLVVEPWLDAVNLATPLDPDDADATYFSYAPHDPSDVVQNIDFKPRTIERRVLGDVVSRTYHVYHRDGNHDRVHIEEHAAHGDAEYGDLANERSVTIHYGTNASSAARGRIKSRVGPDGRIETYSYQAGNFVASTNGLGVFTEGTGSFLRIVRTEGTTNAPNGIAHRTVREIRIENHLAKNLQSEMQVYDGSGYETASWEVRTYDELGRETLVLHDGDNRHESVWGSLCCGKTEETDEYGIRRLFTRDELGRLTSETKEGVPAGAYPAQSNLVTDYTYDADGRVLKRVLTGGSLSLVVASNQYDLAGRLISAADQAGLITTTEYELYGRRMVRTRPDGGTEITERYHDGRTKSVTGTATVPQFYSYGLESGGLRWTVVHRGSSNSPIWEKTVTDGRGRAMRTEHPGFGGVVVTNRFHYDPAGRLVRTEFGDGRPDQLTVYDELGAVVRSGVDVNDNGTLDLSSSDRINEAAQRFVEDGDVWWRETVQRVYAGSGSGVPVTTSVERVAVNESGCGSCGGATRKTWDLHGNQTVYARSVDRNTKTVTTQVQHPFSTNTQVEVSVNGLRVAATTATGHSMGYRYDALGRLVEELQPRTGTNRMAYTSQGRIAWREDAAGHRTTFVYDSESGRMISVTDPLSNTTYTAYDLQGRVTNTWGATYPVAYEYDAYGRMIAMKTWRDTNGAPDITQWKYDEATGLLTNKLYADGQGTAYGYDAQGRLTQRRWARGVTTDYYYDLLGQLTNINYSDNTPDVVFQYDRLGRQTAAITVGVRTNLFTYDPATLALTNETIFGAGLTSNRADLARTYDTLGRPAGIALPSEPTPYSVTYAYDTLGRLSAISSSVASVSSVVNYSYLPGSDLVTGWTNTQGHSFMRSFELNRDLISSVANTHAGVLIRQFDYENDPAGRRIERRDIDLGTILTNLFGYNTRSELISALMDTNDFGYTYDSIGNRELSRVNANTNHYLANELNQYLSVTSVSSVVNLTYDPDGNLTNDGTRAYVWDGENRLIRVEWGTNAVENTYDYMSRRIAKAISVETTGHWSQITGHSFLYDGWNMIRELVTDNGSPVTNSYTWGLDLSSTMQGAGGIGGLLSVSVAGVGDPGPFFPSYDANGNIAAYTSTNGTLVARYDYDAYGSLLAQSGSLVDVFVYKFSTKYTDAETGLVYYGYRFYTPELGRWLSRDPSQERGGLNLYAFARNETLGRMDYLGRWSWRSWAFTLLIEIHAAIFGGNDDDDDDPDNGGFPEPPTTVTVVVTSSVSAVECAISEPVLSSEVSITATEIAVTATAGSIATYLAINSPQGRVVRLAYVWLLLVAEDLGCCTPDA